MSNIFTDDYWRGFVLGLQENSNVENTQCYLTFNIFLANKNELVAFDLAKANTAASNVGLTSNMFAYLTKYAKRINEGVIVFFNFYA